MIRLYTLFLRQVELHAGRLAIEFRPRYRTLSSIYRRFGAEARAIAVRLWERGIGPGDRVLVCALGSVTSGILWAWVASRNKPGVNLIDEYSEDVVRRLGSQVKTIKRFGDIVVASIHWGSNWGYDIPHEQRTFAHRLIDEAQVDMVHGHSSHHSKGVEVHRDKPIIYGCGDFLNDYGALRKIPSVESFASQSQNAILALLHFSNSYLFETWQHVPMLPGTSN